MTKEELIEKLQNITTISYAEVKAGNRESIVDVETNNTGDIILVSESDEYYEPNIKRIANYYGLDSQKDKLIEELAELIRALAKDDEDNIEEEMADVILMINQVKYLMGISIKDVFEYKIKRQLDRIKILT